MKCESSHKSKCKTFVFKLFYYFAFLSISSCQHQTKSDYTISMEQCGRMISAINHYKKLHNAIPDKMQLDDFMQKHDYDLNSKTTSGWIFYNSNDSYFARKNQVKMESGRTVDIIITRDSDFIIRDSNAP